MVAGNDKKSRSPTPAQSPPPTCPATCFIIIPCARTLYTYMALECDRLPLSLGKLNPFLPHLHHQSSSIPNSLPTTAFLTSFTAIFSAYFAVRTTLIFIMCSNGKTPSFKDKRRFMVPKSRITPKKHKFLSLRRQFPPGEPSKGGCSAVSADRSQSHQPIDLMENPEHENVAYFFSAADGGAASLTGLLDSAAESNSSHATDDSWR